jgi:NAD(P)-dependent dehydrogenase (short-subunit alcohol dehydrogenase family)
MAARRALTRIPAYSAAKAAVENLTRWLAVDLARKHGGAVRVNAIAPGFLLGEQNRSLLCRRKRSRDREGTRDHRAHAVRAPRAAA